MARLFDQYGRPEWHLLALALVTSLLGRTIALVPPLVLGVAIDAVFVGNAPYTLPLVPPEHLPTSRVEGLWFSAALVASALVLSVLLTWAQGVGFSLFSNRVQHRVRVDAYDAMQGLDMSFFDDKQTGQVMSILNNDVRNLKSFLNGTVGGVVQLLVTVTAIAGILFYLNAQLALVTLVAVPLLGTFTVWFMRTVRPLYRALRQSVGDLNTRIENNLDGIEVIKTSSTEGFETSRVSDASWTTYLKTWAVVKLEYLYQPGMELMAGIAFAFTFVVGGLWLVAGPPGPFTGTLLVGEFVTFLFMTQRFVDPLAGAGRIVNSYENARASAERIFDLADRPVLVAESETPVALPRERVDGRIEYDDVSFGYRVDDPVLADVSFVVEPGETVAFVGPTGAGKSTLAKLLLRLYDVDGGSIRVDGVDVRDLSLADLRRAVGYVGQDVYLFDGTVRENLLYGAFDASPEEMVAAARAAEAHAFVSALPEGYDTRIGERGVKLSGGQRQRLSIARAMLQDPAILVLDEATSSVDTETELYIQRALDALTEGRTTVVIAHRLSTVRNADLVLVLDGGGVVERGTHDALLATPGLYATLWGIQAGDTEGLPDELVDRFARESGPSAND
ncbi:multidrug ABC transporter ATP-binding protein [Salinigranum rubrum]|uniref:Multidrug ABC transporter ATP-binding protein n=1 Tax=Salinigranum rubrum TaxID=755307 RepID=A0A2I8VQ39_9EURY|nr:ABC transporter ATP-binding protein [Salinigranum rubrum]AUV84042.1 multidrug ABC transporter ATP-binding protein [Salinigranum rubrum]